MSSATEELFYQFSADDALSLVEGRRRDARHYIYNNV